MKHIEPLIKDYLSMDTDYALFLTGNWGGGKTYFFKHVLAPTILESRSLRSKENNKYKIVYLSLFGMKSLEDLQTQILLSIYGANGRKAKMATSIVSACLKGATSFLNIDIEGGDMKANALDVKGFDDLVLCFDDLERKHKEFDSNEFTSYVSYLIENHKAKILIIGNEDKIKDDFGTIKEKIIGNSIEFQPNFAVSIESIINDKFSTGIAYKSFLLSQKAFILEVFLKTSRNLRTLKYALNLYQKMFAKSASRILSNRGLNANKESIYKDTLYYAIIISNEYRNNEISFVNDRGVRNMHDIFMKQFMNKKDVAELKEYNEEFYERYYLGNHPIYFSSIYDYITGGADFEQEDFIRELNEKYYIENTELSEHEKTIKLLSWDNCCKLSEKDYKRLTTNLVEFARKGLYDTTDKYWIVFYYATRCENILGYKPDLLVTNLIKGINKAKLIYSENFEHFTTADEASAYYKQQKELLNVLSDRNKKARYYIEKEKAVENSKLCNNDIVQFCHTVTKDGPNILIGIEAKVFYNAFVKVNNEAKRNVWSSVKNLPSSWGISGFTKLYPFWDELYSLLVKNSGKFEKKTVNGYFHKELRLTIEYIVSKRK